MLHNEHLGFQQRGVHGPSAAAGVVDVEGIDTYQTSAAIAEEHSGLLGKEGVGLEIRVGCPALRPACLNKHSFARDLNILEGLRSNRQVLAVIAADEQGIQVGKRLEPDLREVLSIGIAMEWAIDVGTRVGDQLDLADLELGTRRIALA